MKLNPQKATLSVPDDFAVRWDVLYLHSTNPVRGLAAALGVCWRGEGRPKTLYNAANPAQYGGAVLSELVQRKGTDMGDILIAGHTAKNLLDDSIVNGPEVDKVEENSDAGTVATTPA